jgi:hypothetical protein
MNFTNKTNPQIKMFYFFSQQEKMNSIAHTFKIRASMLSHIMTDPRSKSEPLSKTCITYLVSRVKEKVYGRRKDLSSIDAIAKGIECENEAILILNKAL